jgi:hypothetical protein
MLIGTSDRNGQRRTPFADQNMDFCPFLLRLMVLVPFCCPLTAISIQFFVLWSIWSRLAGGRVKRLVD